MLLEQATRASDSGNHRHALDLAVRAGAIQMTPSLLSFIASEQESVGDLASALGTATLCVREAQRDASLLHRGAILSNCRMIAASMRSRVAMITVHLVPADLTGATVSINGQRIEPALLGGPIASTPGHSVIEATAPGRTAFRHELDVAVEAEASMWTQTCPRSRSRRRPRSHRRPSLRR